MRSAAEGPLAGIRVVVTRPAGSGVELASELVRLGATVDAVPLIVVQEADSAALDSAFAASHEWVVFTSANGVRAAGSRLRQARATRFAAVGPATADELRSYGIEPAFVPDRFAADEVVPGLGELEGVRVLLPQADIADSGLGDALRTWGAVVDEVVAYRTVAVQPDETGRAALRAAHAILLASGSAARSLAALALGRTAGILVCIGPSTATAAREEGLEVGLVADEATSQGMIRALVSHFGGNG